MNRALSDFVHNFIKRVITCKFLRRRHVTTATVTHVCDIGKQSHEDEKRFSSEYGKTA